MTPSQNITNSAELALPAPWADEFNTRLQTGEKLQAWLEYYSEPKQCFGVRDSRQMVWCVEQRQQAKANFERQWQQKFALSQPE